MSLPALRAIRGKATHVKEIMATNVDIVNITEKVVRLGRGATAPYRLTPFFDAGHNVYVQVITLASFDAGDAVKFTYKGVESASVVQGTNAAASDVQGRLRALGGDLANVVVTGTTNTGPFTVTFPAGIIPSAITVTSGTGSATGTVTSSKSTAPLKVSVDLDSLSIDGRRDLQLLLSSGSIIVGKTGTLDVTAVPVTNIALGRSRVRVGKTGLPRRTQVTLNLTTLGYTARRDLINLLASGSIAVGTAATLSVQNISSKQVRIGSTSIPPKRKNATYGATVNATTLNANARRDLQRVLAAGQAFTRTA